MTTEQTPYEMTKKETKAEEALRFAKEDALRCEWKEQHRKAIARYEARWQTAKWERRMREYEKTHPCEEEESPTN